MTKLDHAIILDDEPLFSFSFALLLEKYHFCRHVETFSHLNELIQHLVFFGEKEVYVFLDYYLEDQTGLSIISEVKRINKKVKVIFLTGGKSPSLVQNIYLSKPHGILSKRGDIHELKKCFEHIDKNCQEPFLDETMKAILENSTVKTLNFTTREIEILNYFANGHGINETAIAINLSKHTIISHRRSMMSKACCKTIGQLIKIAKDNGFI